MITITLIYLLRKYVVEPRKKRLALVTSSQRVYSLSHGDAV
jgi:hypothetical protein